MLSKKEFKHLLTLGRRAAKLNAEMSGILDSLPLLEQFSVLPSVFCIDGYSLRKILEVYPDAPLQIEQEGDDWYKVYTKIEGCDFEGWMSGKQLDRLKGELNDAV